jgi:hypothetical protein
MYKTQRAGNKVWVRKDERVTVLQDHIKQQLQSLELKLLEGVYCYEVHAAFCSAKNDWLINNHTKLRKVDLSNAWKVIEDAIFDSLGVDDSFGVHISLSKCFLPTIIETPPHYVAVCITTYKLLLGNHGKNG